MLNGVPLFLVKGASTTRWSSLIFPLAMVNGSNSFEEAPVGKDILEGQAVGIFRRVRSGSNRGSVEQRNILQRW